MTRALYDSVTASRLPSDAALVGAYVDGTYANEAAVRARCPHATLVTITTRAPGKPGAHVADVETYDLTPAQGAAWAAAEIHAGRKPTLYCNASTWPAVKAEVDKRQITVSYWIAHYDARAEMIPGAIAKQYQERTDQNLDYSIAADYWPGVDPDPISDQSNAAPVPLEDIVTPADIAAVAKAVTDQVIVRVMEDATHPHTLVNIKAGVDKLNAAPVNTTTGSVDLDALAAKVADLLAKRLAS